MSLFNHFDQDDPIAILWRSSFRRAEESKAWLCGEAAVPTYLLLCVLARTAVTFWLGGHANQLEYPGMSASLGGGHIENGSKRNVVQHSQRMSKAAVTRIGIGTLGGWFPNHAQNVELQPTRSNEFCVWRRSAFCRSTFQFALGTPFEHQFHFINT